MSTIFDYADSRIETLDKEVLFYLVKREGNKDVMVSNRWEAYKNATLMAINGVTAEFISESMSDIRGEDAVCDAFYDLTFEFFIKGLIDEKRFIAIMQPIIKTDLACSYVEHKRMHAISRIPRVFEEDGMKAMIIVLEKLMPQNKNELIKLILKRGVHKMYVDLFEKYFKELVAQCQEELKEEFKHRYGERECLFD